MSKYYIEEEMTNYVGYKVRTKESTLERIRELLLEEDDLRRGRNVNTISDDDLLEIGYYHYAISEVEDNELYECYKCHIITIDSDSEGLCPCCLTSK